tara:strand:- start:23648 stop:23950 length:303 start_codon:yes stop_codon:yes gene_type:complete
MASKQLIACMSKANGDSKKIAACKSSMAKQVPKATMQEQRDAYQREENALIDKRRRKYGSEVNSPDSVVVSRRKKEKKENRKLEKDYHRRGVTALRKRRK